MPKFFKQHLLTPPHLLGQPEGSDPSHQLNANFEDYNPIKTLISWKAPARPFRKKDRSYYVTVVILLVLISLIALLAGEMLLVGVLFALGFMIYVLNFISPDELDYKISTQGVTIGDHFYHWDELDSFWMDEKDKHKTLHILTHIRFPSMLIMPIGDFNEEQIKRVVAQYLPFHEIAPKTFVDRWAEKLQKHFPLENPKPST